MTTYYLLNAIRPGDYIGITTATSGATVPGTRRRITRDVTLRITATATADVPDGLTVTGRLQTHDLTDRQGPARNITITTHAVTWAARPALPEAVRFTASWQAPERDPFAPAYLITMQALSALTYLTGDPDHAHSQVCTWLAHHAEACGHSTIPGADLITNTLPPAAIIATALARLLPAHTLTHPMQHALIGRPAWTDLD